MKSAKKAYLSKSSILPYFGIKSESYWHINYDEYEFPYNGKNYFWDISKKALFFDGEKDKKGICLYIGVDGKKYYNVIEIAQYALACYELYLKLNENRYLNDFINHCNWLIDNQMMFKNCYGIWINVYPVPLFKIDFDWSSALTQAFGISALTRAFRQTGDEKYLASARKAALSFSTSALDGGVFSEQDEFLCLEEYATQKPSSVLNGYISAILSIYDLVQLDVTYQKLYETHIENLATNLNKWDAVYWSWYDLWENHEFIASYFYHNLHIKQLKILHKLTNKVIFKTFYQKWEKNSRSVNCRMKALYKKIKVRLK